MIPIFIIVKDRLTVLKQSIESYEKYIDSPIKIVLIDNKSTYPQTVDFLKSSKYDVIYNIHAGELYKKSRAGGDFNLGGHINGYIGEMDDDVTHYVVTDPDIAFHKDTPGDILEFYIHLMKTEMERGYKNLVCVAPMLDIDDIPDCYPYKSLAIGIHSKDFWSLKQNSITFKDKSFHYIYCQNDTSFALYKRSTLWKKATASAIRVKPPYSAKHLDWYIDPEKMPDDQKYYIHNSNTHNGISHWAGYWMKYGLPYKSRKFNSFGCKQYILKDNGPALGGTNVKTTKKSN